MNISELLGEINIIEGAFADADARGHGNRVRFCKVRPGSLFVCIRGLRYDGHRFANEAVKSGARVIVVERPLDLSPFEQAPPVLRVADSRVPMRCSALAYYGHPALGR